MIVTEQPILNLSYDSSATTQPTLTPSGSNISTVLSDENDSTYIELPVGSATGFNFTDTPPSGKLKLASRLKISGYSFGIEATKFKETFDGNYSQTFDVIYNATNWLTPAYKDDLYYFARVHNSSTQNSIVLRNLVKLVQYINVPEQYPSVTRSGDIYNVNFGYTLDNEDKFVSYSAKTFVGVFHPSQYLASGFNPEELINNNSAVYSTVINDTVSSTLYKAAGMKNETPLDVSTTYRIYYRQVLSLTSVYDSGWNYIEFTTVSNPVPQTPIVTDVSSNTFAKIFNIQTLADQYSGYTFSKLTVDSSTDNNSFKNIATITTLASDYSAQVRDNAYDCTKTMYYRFVSYGVDASNDEYMSAPLVVTVEPDPQFFFGTETHLITQGFITSEFESATYEDDNQELWPKGATAPVVMLGSKRLEKGTITIYLKDFEVEIGDEIIKENKPVKFVDPHGRLHVAMLSETRNIRQPICGHASILSATYQDVI